MHFFDGFRTSHEINKIELPDVDAVAGLINQDALKAFRDGALNPEHPTLRNTVQNGDVYFQIREANNPFYDALPDTVQDYMDQLSAITGRAYHLFDYYGDMLTERQRMCLDLRYNQDLSLAEIAEELGVSRQGVHDNIIRAEAHLQKMEEKTGCVRRYLQSRSAMQTILEAVETLKEHSDPVVRETAEKIAVAAGSIEE